MSRQVHTSHPPFYKFILYILILVGLIMSIIWWIARSPLPPGRLTIITLGDPLETISYDTTRDSWTIINMTKDAHISGIFGLGEYRLDALWELGKSESTPSALLRESLAEEFGVSIPYYIAPQNDSFSSWSHPISHTKSVITLTNLLPFLRKQLDSNISPTLYLQLWWRLRSMELNKVERYILREDSGLVLQKAPDNATFLRFDRRAFDTRTTDAFEELIVRQEAKRIVVFNTTKQPAIGARVGRMISKLGANVVAVGNDTEITGKPCMITGTAEELTSHTAARIVALFGCEKNESEEQGQGDLVVRVGEEFAQRFPLVDN